MQDGRFLAAAPLEQKFWDNFCDAIGLAPVWREDTRDPRGTMQAIAECIASATSAEWRQRLSGRDVCCSIVARVEEALSDPHFRARGLFARQLTVGGRAIAALPVPIDPSFCRDDARAYPALGEDNELIGDRGAS